MENTIEIRYDSLLDIVRQMPSELLTKLLADLRRILEKKHPLAVSDEPKYRPELLEALQDFGQGNAVRYTSEQMYELLHEPLAADVSH